MTDWNKTLRLLPGYDPFRFEAGRYVFSEEVAERACAFFPACLTHMKGEKAGQPFELEGWQKALVGNIFGWFDPKTDKRRFREAFIFVPRKNGKTILAAGFANLFLFVDGEPGAEVYCAAADTDQARLVFTMAKHMVTSEPQLANRAKLYRSAIECPESMSTFRVISSTPDSKHGFNSHCNIIDELHAIPDPELVDVLMTSQGARSQPFTIHITTAGHDRQSICYEKYDYAGKVRDGVIDDPTFLPVIYEAGQDDDWTDEAVWAKANPNLGVSVSLDYLRRECQKAQDVPRFENTFRNLYLNQWTEQAVRFIAMHAWNGCAGEVDLDKLEGKPCWVGLDLGIKRDLTALVAVWKVGRKRVCYPWFWMPEDTARDAEKRDRVPYLTWARQGHIELTPGDVTDYGYVRKQVNAIAGRFKLSALGVDPYNATQLNQQLQDEDGLPVYEYRQSYPMFNDPTVTLEEDVTAGTLVHPANPVLDWMASNVEVKNDTAGNIKPIKPDRKDARKIDGIVALIMAIGTSLTAPEQKPSVYETRGVTRIA